MASQSRYSTSRWWATLAIRKFSLIVCLVILAGLLGARTAQAAPGDPLEVTVDGRIVTVSPDTQAELDGNPLPLEQLLNILAPQAPVQALHVDENRTDGTTVVLPGVEAVVNDHRIAISGLSHQLAQQATISIWIVGSNWRVCIIITWGSYDNPIVSVDGRPVGSHDVVVENQGKASSLTLIAPILGDAPVTTTAVTVLSSPGVTLTTPSAYAVVQRNRIRLHNLTHELAQYGRLSIWVTIGGIRICVIIEWSNPATLSATVDGRPVTVEGQEAQVAGAPAEVERALAILGSATYTSSNLEVVTLPAPGTPIPAPGAFAVIKGNKIAVSNLSHELAIQGRFRLWITIGEVRICVILGWGSDSALKASVDGRPVTVGGQEAQVDGAPAEVERALAIIGSDTVTDTSLEIQTLDGLVINKPTALAVIKGNQIAIKNLTQELAAAGKLSIWISGSKWRICIIIVWGSDSALKASVDGRPVTVGGQEAQVDGVSAEVERALAIIGSDTVTDTSLEIQTLDGLVINKPTALAVIKGNQIAIKNLTQELAAAGKLSIWISGSKWRICIIIVWGSDSALKASVDGRPVTVGGQEAQVDGAPAEVERALAIIGSDTVTDTSLEIQTLDGLVINKPTALAVIKGNQIAIKNLTQELAAAGKLSIWISGGKWRICIIIVWGSDSALKASVDGRPATVGGQEAQVDGVSAEVERALAIIGSDTVTDTSLEIQTLDGLVINKPTALAVIKGNQIAIKNLTQELAAAGKLSIWISGSKWRICIIIVWGSDSALKASVDGRAVTVGGQEAQVDGAPAEVERALAIIGSDTVTDTSLEIQTLDGLVINKPTALAVIKGNQIAIKNLTQELAAYGKLSIWISGGKWRICIIIIWGSDSALKASVDGRPVTVGGQEAQVDGVSAEVERALAIIGSDTVTDTSLEIQTLDGLVINKPTALAVIKGNQIAIKNLTQELAAAGKLSIWISGGKWRICIIIVWGSDSALKASVDGRAVTVGGQEAQVDGVSAEVERALAIIGSDTVTDTSLEIQTLDGVTLTVPAAFAVIKGNQIAISNLDHELATEFHLSLWFGKGPWRICIIIGWGNSDTLAATVDGRDVIISDAVAQLSGANIDIARALDILGDAEVTSADLQVQTSNGVTLTTPPGAQAVMKGNLLTLTKLSEPLAKHIIITVWVRLSNTLRVCVTIEINTDDLLPKVTLNGRPVTVEGPVAEIDGQNVEPSQLFAFLDQPTPATKIEIVKNGVPSTTKSIQAVVNGGQIAITDPGGALQQVRISIWISGSRWRICIIISFERLTSPDGAVIVDVPAHLVHGGLDLTYDGLTAPTHALPSGAIGLRHFKLNAHSISGPVHQLDVDYSLKVKYTATQLASLNAAENTLRLVVWDDATSQWMPIASTVDAPNDTVTGMLDHFSEFALIGDSAGSRSLYLPIISR
jgi:hypothetical protein